METWQNGKKIKEIWHNGKKCKEIWKAGKKIFDSRIPIPTDYYLALDLTSNINDKSSNAHAMSGNNYSFHNIAGKDCIEFTQGIRTTNNVELGDLVTISFDMYITNNTVQSTLIELSSNYNSNDNLFTVATNALSATNNIVTTDKKNSSLQLQIRSNSDIYLNNEWVNVIIVFDRTKTIRSEQRDIYINGVLQSKTISGNSSLSGNWGSYPLYIGARGLTTNVMQGYMRNFRLYKRLLTDEERLALYQE